MDKGYKASGKTPFEAIRNYMKWAEARVQSTDSDDAIASDLGIDCYYIPAVREILKLTE